MTFVRFPHTPHLAWLANSKPRDDKVLSPSAARALLTHEVTIEEKVDGANIGISGGKDGSLYVQNRGSYLSPGDSHPQFKPLFRWLEPRRQLLVEVLGRDLILFGEWCYAVHSVRYTMLPDWFLAFDVFDRTKSLFLSVARRTEVARQLQVAVVPCVATGRFQLAELVKLLGPSKLGTDAAEGLYIRRDDQDHLAERAKLVRPEFVQNMKSHWSSGSLRTNTLAVEKPLRHR